MSGLLVVLLFGWPAGDEEVAWKAFDAFRLNV